MSRGRWRFARPLITYSLEFDRGGFPSADFESERKAKGNGTVVNVEKRWICQCFFFFVKRKFEKNKGGLEKLNFIIAFRVFILF